MLKSRKATPDQPPLGATELSFGSSYIFLLSFENNKLLIVQQWLFFYAVGIITHKGG